MEIKDPVFKKEDGWYFKDESETIEYGPYPTQGNARLNLLNYMHEALKNAAEKVEKINEELKTTHNKTCTCDMEMIPDEQVFEIDEEVGDDTQVISMVDGLPVINDPLKDIKLPEIPNIWEKPKEKIKAKLATDSTSNDVVVIPKNKKKVLSSSVIVTIWAIIITAVLTAFIFSDFKFSSLFPDVKKQKIEVKITPKPQESVVEKIPVKSNNICVKGYIHYTQFMGQTEEVLKANDFGISVWENPGASKGNMVGKITPGSCVEKLDQQGNNVFVAIEGNKVGWIHVMDTETKK
jgi:hypothetical protein